MIQTRWRKVFGSTRYYACVFTADGNDSSDPDLQMRDEISAVRDRRYRARVVKVYPRFRTDRMTAQASFRSASRECHLGIPAANHDPDPADRMRSTGLVQGFGGAGESVSSMRKSPFTSRGTPAKLELCWTFPSLAQNSVAKTLAFALLPTALPEPRRSPRPPSRMLPSCFTSAARSRITQIWPAAVTPRTVVFAEPVGITPIPPSNLTKFWAKVD